MLSDTPVTGVMQPQVVGGETPSSLCVTGLTPAQLLQGAFIAILRRHFAATAKFDRTMLPSAQPIAGQDGFKFYGAKAQTGLVIESAGRWDPVNAGKRAAVLVKRNAFQAQRVSINNQTHGASPLDGNTKYGLLQLGSLTCFAIATTESAADHLGTEVFNFFTEFGPVIRKDLRLTRVEATSNGEPGLLEESKQHWAVPVTVATAFWQGWTYVEYGPALKTIEIRTNQE